MRQQKVSTDAVDEEVIPRFLAVPKTTPTWIECQAPDAWLRELLSPEAI